MAKRPNSPLGLLLAALLPVAGCSSNDSATPPQDPVEGRKVKDEMLKNMTGPGNAKSGKAATSPEDRF